MYFWLKLLHIAAMAVWFTGLFFLPRLLRARRHAPRDTQNERLGRALYFGVMTPGAVLTIALGMLLLAWGANGAWLPAKLALVSIAVLLHLYFGQRLVDGQQAGSLRDLVDRLLTWLPLPLLLGITALAAVKPGALPPLGPM